MKFYERVGIVAISPEIGYPDYEEDLKAPFEYGFTTKGGYVFYFNLKRISFLRYITEKLRGARTKVHTDNINVCENNAIAKKIMEKHGRIKEAFK